MTNSKAQAQDIDFELHTLGWKAFQNLCATITREVLGQTSVEFLPSNDGGRDGAFYGTWNHKQGGVPGPYVVQCKHTSKLGTTLSLSDLAEEIKKAEVLGKKGLATNYVLMTNLGISGSAEEDIRAAFRSVSGVSWVGVYGSTWISSVIRERPRLRVLVPRVYGLGDLSQILDERAYAQAQQILASMGGELGNYVVTDAYHRSAKAILDHGFVMLLGEPAAGKSLIAGSLTLGAIDAFGATPLKLRGADDFIRHWNPNEKQLFWFDDVFGSTQYQKDLALSWNGTLAHLQAAITSGSKAIFTSRTYVFEAAMRDLKLTAFPLLKSSQVLINVHDLTEDEKEQILYNHIKRGDQPQEFKTRVKKFLPSIAAKESFLPEVARRLGRQIFTKRLRLSDDKIAEFVDRPLGFLLEVVQSLDVGAKAALSLILMRGGNLTSPVELSEGETRSLSRLGANVAGTLDSLQALNGSLVTLQRGAQPTWRFKHPTIADAVAEHVAGSLDLVDIYLAGTEPQKLIHEVTCGDADVYGAKVVIPASRYPAVIAKLDALAEPEKAYTFLAYRCDKAFFQEYLGSHPDFLQDAVNGLQPQLNCCEAALLLDRAQELSLLPNVVREAAVKEIGDLSISLPGSEFLQGGRVASLFTAEERAALLVRICNEVLTRLEDVVSRWAEEYHRKDDPSAFFEELQSTLKSFKDAVGEDELWKTYIDEGLADIESRIESLEENRTAFDANDREFPEDLSRGFKGTRNIFDDVDQ